MKRQIEEELLLNVTAYILADNPSAELREKCKKGLLAEINRIATNQLYKDFKTSRSQEEREEALKKWYEAKGIPQAFRMI